eukprot:6201899-Pleurochrysis_carterae.AAC.1
MSCRRSMVASKAVGWTRRRAIRRLGVCSRANCRKGAVHQSWTSAARAGQRVVGACSFIAYAGWMTCHETGPLRKIDSLSTAGCRSIG